MTLKIMQLCPLPILNIALQVSNDISSLKPSQFTVHKCTAISIDTS